jgi:NitT/TauT family transport system substrate-binding protein
MKGRLPMPMTQSRRRFLTTVSMAGVVGLADAPAVLAEEESLETTAVRLERSAALCIAPQYLVEELLRADGFTDIRYIEGSPPGVTERVAHGTVDFQTNYAPNFITAIDRGEPITLLTGVMVGCYELFGNEDTRSITDLKGKTVGMQALGSIGHILVTLMAAHVGLDPGRDLHWVTDPKVKPKDLFIDGKIDAFLGFPPEPQELRERRIGHVIVNSAVDRPWSQYLCCIRNTSTTIRSQPSVWCAPSSRRRIFARPNRPAPRDDSSIAGSPSVTIMPCRR